MDEKSNPSEAAQQEEVRDRARRRLLKLGGYLTPTLLSLTALLDPRSGYAQAAVRVMSGVIVRADSDYRSIE